jgi:hypothetical protein
MADYGIKIHFDDHSARELCGHSKALAVNVSEFFHEIKVHPRICGIGSSQFRLEFPSLNRIEQLFNCSANEFAPVLPQRCRRAICSLEQAGWEFNQNALSFSTNTSAGINLNCGRLT